MLDIIMLTDCNLRSDGNTSVGRHHGVTTHKKSVWNFTARDL